MGKIWFFVEGDSEDNFVNKLILRRYYSEAKTTKDLVAFIREPAENNISLCYVTNCGSVNKIPFEINENYHFIKEANTNDIVIVCDVEQELCYVNRKQKILDKLNIDVDQSKIKYVFSKPMIEAEYWYTNGIIKRILELEYKKKFQNKKLPFVDIPNVITNPIADLKWLFKSVNLKYREASFSLEYFSRINFEAPSSPAISRIVDLLEIILRI